MSLIGKSTENLEAANLLIENKLFTSAIHHCYYACYQMLMIIQKQLIDKSAIQKQQNILNTESKNSHEETINNVLRALYLTQILDENESRNLKDHFISLKKERTKADYRDFIFDNNTSKRAYKTAKNIHTLLINLYQKIQ